MKFQANRSRFCLATFGLKIDTLNAGFSSVLFTSFIIFFFENCCRIKRLFNKCFVYDKIDAASSRIYLPRPEVTNMRPAKEFHAAREAFR